MSFKCNEDCARFAGDCGKHYKDSNGHIIWDCPSESCYDGAIGDEPICFTPSDEYKKRRRLQETITIETALSMFEELIRDIAEIEEGYSKFDTENQRSLTMIPLERVNDIIHQRTKALKAYK